MSIVYVLAAIFIFIFLVAQFCGVRVNEFSIGMDSCLWHKEPEEYSPYRAM